jgi:hypothetical protein
MPFFAYFHLYAFAYTDYLSPHLMYVARMPLSYAFRDAFGLKDVIEEGKMTLRGEGMDYREFEPSEGYMHQGVGRDRRIRAGLRYSKGGKRKYWLPRGIDESRPGQMERGFGRVVGREEEGGEALLEEDVEDVVHVAPDLQPNRPHDDMFWETLEEGEGYGLPFGDVDDPNMKPDEEQYDFSRQYLFGDYNYPCIDVSTEYARTAMWEEEERVLRDQRGALFSPIRQVQRDGPVPVLGDYGAVGTNARGKAPLPTSKGKVRVAKEVLIDYEQDRTPPAESGDVVLKWTKMGAKRQGSRPTSHSHSHSPSSVPSSVGSSVSPRRHVHGRSLSSASQENTPKSPKTRLSSDAVDLIVEAEEVEDEDRTRERKKGEPGRGTRSGLRKMYQRGFEVEEQQRGAEVESDVQAISPEHERYTSHERNGERVLDPEHNAEVKDANARATTTPPGFARVDASDNPWA